MAKNKMKTHKGSAKVFKKRKSGSIKITRQGVLHNTGKNSSKRSRQKRKGSSSSTSVLPTHTTFQAASLNIKEKARI